ncbi:MAG: outer membrane lipoprotein-sorting protein [Gammaproteobacteria bacterium]|nr:outer membrane lipoprotein-sorting protein [Gammaproteobacteria bacterium]
MTVLRLLKHSGSWLLLWAAAHAAASTATDHGLEHILDEASGAEIMRAVQERHQLYPHVYEEQVMVLQDRLGHRDTRRLRRFTRVEEDGSVRFLLLFDAPEDVMGVALLAVRNASGETRQSFYLPALGPDFIESSERSSQGSFLGSDFTVENLTGEVLADHLYVRRRDERIVGQPYYRIDVYRAGVEPATSSPLRAHFILQDSLFIARTDHFDDLGRVERRQTHHDLVPVGAGVWRPNLVRMDNLRDGHKSYLRIERRIFSADLVPPERFTAQWILANQPPLARVVAAVEDES